MCGWDDSRPRVIVKAFKKREKSAIVLIPIQIQWWKIYKHGWVYTLKSIYKLFI